ncbi:ATP-grasp domain-containing protein [Paenibacillus sp. WLX2291]|uniref:ATP-grasp domain-containing protein n=1 Tax=Paenibacillus sp. WLX2291 TaxID=3296934 RepID=UPI0039842E65
MEELIREFHNTITKIKLSKDFCIVFVYNDVDDLDYLHAAEGITPSELQEIKNSFLDLTEKLFLYKYEKDFTENIMMLKKKFEYILVYSMAQNTKGIGRRSLIPLLCEHFDLINVGNDSYTSFLGGNKQIMYKIIEKELREFIPETHFISSKADIDFAINSFIKQKKSFLIKPNSESASIGVKKIDFQNFDFEEFKKNILADLKVYDKLIVQEYIAGKEIEAPVIHFKDSYIVPGCIEINLPFGAEILTANTIFTENYSFSTFDSPQSEIIKKISIKCAELLGFSAISRIDFRIDENNIYIIDITPNPTVSSMSSTYYAFKNHFENSLNINFQLLIFTSMIKHKLFEPPF